MDRDTGERRGRRRGEKELEIEEGVGKEVKEKESTVSMRERVKKWETERQWKEDNRKGGVREWVKK